MTEVKENVGQLNFKPNEEKEPDQDGTTGVGIFDDTPIRCHKPSFSELVEMETRYTEFITSKCNHLVGDAPGRVKEYRHHCHSVLASQHLVEPEFRYNAQKYE